MGAITATTRLRKQTPNVAKLVDLVRGSVDADIEKQKSSPKPSLEELLADAGELELTAEGIRGDSPGLHRDNSMRRSPTQQQIEQQGVFPDHWMKKAFRVAKVPPKVVVPARGFRMTTSALQAKKYVPGHDVFRGMYSDIRGPEAPRAERTRHEPEFPNWGRFKQSRFSGGDIIFAEGQDLFPVNDGGRLLMEYNPETLTCNVCNGQSMRCKSCESALKYSVWKARAAAEIRDWEASVRPTVLEELHRNEVELAARIRQLHDARVKREAEVAAAEEHAKRLDEERRKVDLVIEEAGRFSRSAPKKSKALQDSVEAAFAENREIRKMLQHVRDRMRTIGHDGQELPGFDMPKGPEMKKYLRQAIAAMNQRIRSIRREVSPDSKITKDHQVLRKMDTGNLIQLDLSGLEADRSNLSKFPPDVQHKVMKDDLEKLEERRRALLRWGHKDYKLEPSRKNLDPSELRKSRGSRRSRARSSSAHRKTATLSPSPGRSRSLQPSSAGDGLASRTATMVSFKDLSPPVTPRYDPL